ncbi:MULTISPECIES: DUF1788 domain-containing protein [Halomonadaceae]|uniref:DUF1788 domain-containing protein n=2 Tax=Halomonas TaxID=2745 RepID=A0A6F8U3V3_9GAMM|nr:MULTISPECIES: DUF1788 domain-containing protein [Halomonas]BCB08142.1 hypothetical protein HHSLTHF2_20320 [Halomonas hydrothermalis]SDI41843.1 protein of unknown function [Halomonas titanicae]
MSQSDQYPPPSGFSHHEDDQLRARLNQVAEKITRPDFLAGQGLGNELGFWIFDYAPEHELQVRAYLNFLPSLMARQHPDIKMAQVNLLEVLKDYLTERGFLDKAIAMQKSKGDAALLKALRGPLHMDKFAPYLIRHSLSHEPDIVLLTGVGSLWPMVRAHSLLNALHGPLGHKPLVLFYPGRYDGQTMSLFKQIKSNNYYRAFALVP